jgi:hypothetical protein
MMVTSGVGVSARAFDRTHLPQAQAAGLEGSLASRFAAAAAGISPPHRLTRRSIPAPGAPPTDTTGGETAIQRLRQALDGTGWVDIHSAPLAIGKASDALRAVEQEAGMGPVAKSVRLWRKTDSLEANPYGPLDLAIGQEQAHMLLDRAALLYRIARRSRRPHGVHAQEDPAAVLRDMRVEFVRALSEETIKKKLFTEPLSPAKFGEVVAGYARVGHYGAGVVKIMKATTDILRSADTLPGQQGKSAADIAASRYVRLFLSDYWTPAEIGENAARLVRDWFDENRLGTEFPLGTALHAIASAMRAAAGRQYAESEQPELLAAFSSLALEQSADGGIPPVVRDAARQLAAARGVAGGPDKDCADEEKRGIGALMDSLRARVGPFPQQFDPTEAALRILVSATGLDASALQHRERREFPVPRPSSKVSNDEWLGIGTNTIVREWPSILDRFLEQASQPADYSAYNDQRQAELRAKPDFFCADARNEQIGINAVTRMDEARLLHNAALKRHPWTIALAKDRLRLRQQALTETAVSAQLEEIVAQYRIPLSQEQAIARKRQVLPALPGIGVLFAIAYGIEDLVAQGDPTTLVYALPAISSMAVVVHGLRDIALGDHAGGMRKLIRVVPILGDLNEAGHFWADGDAEMAILMLANAVVAAIPGAKVRAIPGFAATYVRTGLASSAKPRPESMAMGSFLATGILPENVSPRVLPTFRLFRNRVHPYRPNKAGAEPAQAAQIARSPEAAETPHATRGLPGRSGKSIALKQIEHLQEAELPGLVSPPDAEGIRRGVSCGPDQGYVTIGGRYYPAYRSHGIWHVERRAEDSGSGNLVGLVQRNGKWQFRTARRDLAQAAGLERLLPDEDEETGTVDTAGGARAPNAGDANKGPARDDARTGDVSKGDAAERAAVGSDTSLAKARTRLWQAAATGNFTVQQAQRLVGRHPISKFVDTEKGFVYRGFTFRGDMRPSAEIFEHGFRLREDVSHIHEVNGFRGGFGGGADARDIDGRGISTSPFYDHDNAGAYYYGGHRGGYTYVIDARTLEGYDLYRNRQYVLDGRAVRPGAVSPRPWEVNYGAAIPANKIVGAFDARGRYVANVNYRA